MSKKKKIEMDKEISVKFLCFHCPKSGTWERRINLSWHCQGCKNIGCRPLDSLEERKCAIKINTNQRFV